MDSRRLQTRQTAARVQKNNAVYSVVNTLFSQLSLEHARFLTWLCAKVKLKLTPTSKAYEEPVGDQSSLAGGTCNMLPLLSDISQAAGLGLAGSLALITHIYGSRTHGSYRAENYRANLAKWVSFRLETWKRECTSLPMWNRVQKTRPDPSIVVARVVKHNVWLQAKLEQYKTRPVLKELKRGRIMNLARKWTGDLYRDIQFMKTHNVRNDQNPRRNLTRAAEAEYALRRYMRLFAPRAPMQPHVHAITHLFRGVCLETIGSKMVSNRYLSFTPKSLVADRFRCDGQNTNNIYDGKDLLIRLNVNDIPPGTPWIWFSSANAPRTSSVSSAYDEGEVLLPPGTLTLSNHRIDDLGGYTADAKYTPTGSW
jgi:hypothetical protein